jgi:hypothetical protein
VGAVEEETGLRFHKLVEGNATVSLHYHYDGCSIQLEMDDGSVAVVFPALGDDIMPIDAPPPSVLDRAAAIYAASSPPLTNTSDSSPESTESAPGSDQ